MKPLPTPDCGTIILLAYLTGLRDIKTRTVEESAPLPAVQCRPCGLALLGDVPA